MSCEFSKPSGNAFVDQLMRIVRRIQPGLAMGRSLLFVAGVCVQGVSADEADRSAQLQLARQQFFEALDGLDADVVEKSLAVDFVDIDPNRGLRDRQAFVADLRAVRRPAGERALQRVWTQERSRLIGELGVVLGRSSWRLLPTSAAPASVETRSIWSRKITQQWRWTQQRWLLQSQQTVLMPPPPDIVPFHSGELRLQAMLFRPPGTGPSPAIVYAHGNEPDPSDLLETVGPALAARGWLVFGPHRRGAGLSGDQGENLLSRLTQVEREQGPAARAELAVQQLQGPQLADIAAAIDSLRQRADVDPRRIHVMGNSFGGVLALLAAERGLGLAGVVNFAGAAINWERSEAFRGLMTRAARQAQVPVYLGQAENDYSVEPTRVLSRVLCESGKVYRARVFPAFGISAGEGHALGVDGASRWAEEVLGFLAKPSRDPACQP